MGAPAMVAGCVVKCSFGVMPIPIIAMPLPGKPIVNGMPAVLVTDVTVANMPSFGMCMTQTNPAVAATTAAALGVPTPAPCLPVLIPTWMPGCPNVMFGAVPVATTSSTVMCSYGGAVSVVSPAQVQVVL